jgi:hypothetical protein
MSSQYIINFPDPQHYPASYMIVSLPPHHIPLHVLVGVIASPETYSLQYYKMHMSNLMNKMHGKVKFNHTVVTTV